MRDGADLRDRALVTEVAWRFSRGYCNAGYGRPIIVIKNCLVVPFLTTRYPPAEYCITYRFGNESVPKTATTDAEPISL